MKTSVLLSWEIPENYNSAMPFKVSCFRMCKKSQVKVEGREAVLLGELPKSKQTALVLEHMLAHVWLSHTRLSLALGLCGLSTQKRGWELKPRAGMPL